MKLTIKTFNNLELKYDMLPDCYWEIEELFDLGNITTFDDVYEFLKEYVTEEDEMMLGHINLWKKIEDRDFVEKLFKESEI